DVLVLGVVPRDSLAAEIVGDVPAPVGADDSDAHVVREVAAAGPAVGRPQLVCVPVAVRRPAVAVRGDEHPVVVPRAACAAVDAVTGRPDLVPALAPADPRGA